MARSWDVEEPKSAIEGLEGLALEYSWLELHQAGATFLRHAYYQTDALPSTQETTVLCFPRATVVLLSKDTASIIGVRIKTASANELLYFLLSRACTGNGRLCAKPSTGCWCQWCPCRVHIAK